MIEIFDNAIITMVYEWQKKKEQWRGADLRYEKWSKLEAKSRLIFWDVVYLNI